MPVGFDLNKYLAWDLSPLRPWEWEQVVACEWLEARKVQDAWGAGIEEARGEQKAREAAKAL